MKNKCGCLFSVDDILNYTSVYCYEHAQAIFECLSNVFADMEIDDEELANLQI